MHLTDIHEKLAACPDLTRLLGQVKEQVATCIQCGTCSGSCANAQFMDMTPRRMWRAVLVDRVETVFSSQTFMLCASCYVCKLRCPRGLPLTRAMAELKQVAFDLALAEKTKTGQDVLVGQILDQARAAHAVVTVCPMCQMNLEQFQPRPVPVLYLPQLLGLALGMSAKSLGCDLNLFDLKPVLSRVAP